MQTNLSHSCLWLIFHNWLLCFFTMHTNAIVSKALLENVIIILGTEKCLPINLVALE